MSKSNPRPKKEGRIQLRIDRALQEEAMLLARDQKKTLTEVVEGFLKSWLEQHRRKPSHDDLGIEQL